MSPHYVHGPAEIFTFFFVTLGPLKVLGPFVERTRGLDQATTRQIALRAFAIGTIAAFAGGLVGSAMLGPWDVSIAAMALTGGVVFFLVALRQLLQGYEPVPAAPPEPLPPSPTTAAVRLVFPTVVTPYGIALVIILLAASGGGARTVTILGILVLVMLLNLVAMVYAKRILAGPMVLVLQVFGAVLAVLQGALAVEFILWGLSSMGVLPNWHPGEATMSRP